MKHKFIEQTKQVLNSNTIFFAVDIPLDKDDPITYAEELIRNGRFCNLEGNYLMLYQNEFNLAIPNFEWSPIEIDFKSFKEILVDMLVVTKLHFWNSPNGGTWDPIYAANLVDDFWLSILINQEEKVWKFYTMPRDFVNSTIEEKKYLEVVPDGVYRPMMGPKANPLGRYFDHFGSDCFLVFHSSQRIYFLLTNGNS